MNRQFILPVFSILLVVFSLAFLPANLALAEDKEDAREEADTEELPMPETVEAYKKLVDPVLHWTPRSLEGKKNAKEDWEKAREYYVELDEDDELSTYYSDILSGELTYNSNPKLAKRLDLWIKANEKALEYFDKGLNADYILIHEPGLSDSNDKDSGLCRRMSSLHGILYRIEFDNGNTDKALQHLATNYRIASILVYARPAPIDLLIAHSIDAQTIHLFQNDLFDLSESQMNRMLQIMKRKYTYSELNKRSIRVFFWRVLACKARNFEQGKPDTNWIKLRNLGPVKTEDVLELASPVYASFFGPEFTKWHGDFNDREEYDKHFNKVLSQAKKTSQELLKKNHAGHKLTDEERDLIAKPFRLKEADKIVRNIWLPLETLTRAYNRVTNSCNATRIILAYQIYKKQNPGKADTLTLKDLVEAKLLDEVPMDAFSKDNQPLQIDLKRSIVWSVGPDGVDNQGNAPEWFNSPADEGEDDVWYLTREAYEQARKKSESSE